MLPRTTIASAPGSERLRLELRPLNLEDSVALQQQLITRRNAALAARACAAYAPRFAAALRQRLRESGKPPSESALPAQVYSRA